MILYSVNKSRKTITASFEESWFESLCMMCHNINPHDEIDEIAMVVYRVLRGFPVQHATTRLCNGDTWNEKVGKEMARNKLFDSFNRAKHQVKIAYKKRLEHLNDAAMQRLRLDK